MAIEFYTGMAELASFTPLSVCTLSLWYVELGWNVVHNRLFGTADNYETRIDSVYHDVYNELGKGTGIYTTNTVPAGTWTHLAFTLDTASGNAATYFNGQFDINDTGHSAVPGAATLGIGGRYGAGVGQYANGILEDVRLYNRVLSAGEIQTLYACHGSDGIISGLVHRWILATKGGAGSVGVGGDNIQDTLKSTLNVLSGDAYYWGGKNKTRQRVGC